MRQPSDIDVLDYFEQGYTIFPDALEPDELAALSKVCDLLMAEPPDDDMGGTAHDIGKGPDRRFLRHRHRDHPDLSAFVLGPSMRAFVSRFVGKTPYLFNEQFVVKGPKTGAAFAWHQDSGYVGFDHTPYLSVWIAVDETTRDNGPVHLLPRNLNRDTAVLPHQWDDQGKEMVGYDGPEPGVEAIVPAGSVVIFSSVTLHRSSPNITDAPRRAFLAQYSGEPIIDPATGVPKTFATAL